MVGGVGVDIFYCEREVNSVIPDQGTGMYYRSKLVHMWEEIENYLVNFLILEVGAVES